jgi:hypothetical protein
MHALAHQRRRTKGYLPWLLSYLLLAQALFPIQAHTQWVTDSDGMVVAICSLLGERTAVIDVEHDDTTVLDEYRSPACLFSTLLGATVASSPIPVPEVRFLATVLQADPVRDLPTLRNPLVQAIRAPPMA